MENSSKFEEKYDPQVKEGDNGQVYLINYQKFVSIENPELVKFEFTQWLFRNGQFDSCRLISADMIISFAREFYLEFMLIEASRQNLLNEVDIEITKDFLIKLLDVTIIIELDDTNISPDNEDAYNFVFDAVHCRKTSPRISRKYFRNNEVLEGTVRNHINQLLEIMNLEDNFDDDSDGGLPEKT